MSVVIPNPGLNKVIYVYVNKVILYVRNYHFVANVPTSVAIYDILYITLISIMFCSGRCFMDCIKTVCCCIL